MSNTTWASIECETLSENRTIQIFGYALRLEPAHSGRQQGWHLNKIEHFVDVLRTQAENGRGRGWERKCGYWNGRHDREGPPGVDGRDGRIILLWSLGLHDAVNLALSYAMKYALDSCFDFCSLLIPV